MTDKQLMRPPLPGLDPVFSIRVHVAAPIELGPIDGGSRRFIPIIGGDVSGPGLTGTVLAGGGDWQTVQDGGVTQIEARYFLKASDGAIIEVANPGVRVGTPDVIARLSAGEEVDPADYYFSTTPTFKVADGPHDWLRRSVFIGRAIRLPALVLLDLYAVR